MNAKLFFFACMAAIMMGCNGNPKDSGFRIQDSGVESTEKAPIGKPQITIKGGRMTPEALWSMGRIGSVKTDLETGWLAYTVSYYSIEENRSTSWIRICNPYENMRVDDEFVGSEPAWFGGSGWIAFIRGGQLYLRRDSDEVLVNGANDIEGFPSSFSV